MAGILAQETPVILIYDIFSSRIVSTKRRSKWNIRVGIRRLFGLPIPKFENESSVCPDFRTGKTQRWENGLTMRNPDIVCL